ncbi:sigma-E processing peptidase SpoIIGA [Bacillota bacterium]
MVVYGEYLFIENAIAGVIILALTGRICGFSPAARWLAAGSILCGIYAFILFLEGIPWPLAILLKLVFSVGLVALVFQCSYMWKLIKTLLVFYIVSIALGGIIIASLYMFSSIGITHGGVFYIGQVTYVKVFAGMLLAWIAMYGFSNLLKSRVKQGRKEASLCVKIDGKAVILKGFIDTGNFLRDPLSGRPVCIAAAGVLEDFMTDEMQYCIVPYRSVDNVEGILHGIRLDHAELMIKGSKTRAVDIVLAISKARRPLGRKGENYDVILNEALAEGGVLSDD